MASEKDSSLELDNNAFGKLVKAFREQRGWSQGELAERWGFTREYVSQIERGKRKLDKQEYVYRLADILGIPQERLDAIGRGLPKRHFLADKPADADDILLQTLLEPSLATVKLSWLLWLADGVNIPLAENLLRLTERLEDTLTRHHGQFLKPAQQVLAYAHEMQGKMAFDQLRYTHALGHFQEMLDLGEELSDANIIALAQIQRADVLRKRGRYEASVQCLQALRPVAERAEQHIQGIRWQVLARAHAAYGYQDQFLEAIDHAEMIATQIKETIDTQYLQFNLVEVLQERAQGYTMLWQPEKALEIYLRTDRLKPFRPLRDLGSYTIIKAQAHTYCGDIETGVDLAVRGIELARGYKSARHISRVQGMYDRLRVTPLGSHPRMKDLKDVLMSQQK
ncbi:MAG: helix-turn-helix transcriptional regulator [Ktedonobacteraceae bacterium]|nr:helix-turn-helix transcriptional regulator [Ktedonobacteraceae bacterium]